MEDLLSNMSTPKKEKGPKDEQTDGTPKVKGSKQCKSIQIYTKCILIYAIFTYDNKSMISKFFST